jgi:hypothetical protein
MGQSAAKRRSRKRRARGGVPRAVPSQRRERRARPPAFSAAPRQPLSATQALGERPPSPFGGLPVSELAILVGLVGVIVGFVNGGPALIVGVVVCVLAVAELTAREHLSGFRSHTTLLAAFPALMTQATVRIVGGAAGGRAVLLPAAGVFAGSFWLLRRRFQRARHRRLTSLS